MNTFKKSFSLSLRRNVWRNESNRTPLLEKNNNILEANNELYDNPLDQNILHIHPEPQPKQELMLQELAELLEVGATSITSVDECCCSGPDQQLKPGAVLLMQKSVSQHFPKPPADLDQDLLEHLNNVKNVVLSELLRLSPQLESPLWGCLIDCYHQQTFDHLHVLLQKIGSSRNCLALIMWGLKTYLSQELIGHPGLQQMDLINKIDILLWTEWGEKAKGKLLEIVQNEVRMQLEKILQNEKDQEVCDSEEAFIQLYVDTIKCIYAAPTEAEKISFKLSVEVQEVCFQQLLVFLQRYKEEQTETLRKKAKMDEPKTIYFFKTLETCEKLKQYIQTNGRETRTSHLEETCFVLEEMYTLTLNLLTDIVTNITKRHLKNYFSADNKQFFSLIQAVKTISPKQCNSQDVREKVMDKIYNIIVHFYVEHLFKTSPRRLKKCWGCSAEQKISEDAELLHAAISHLAPDVHQWNQKMLDVTEVLRCSDKDGLQLTVASIQKQSSTKSEDLKFLLKLLQWNGLTKRDARKMLDIFCDDGLPGPAWYSCFICQTINTEAWL